MSELHYQHGRLSYRKKSTGVERGREDWWLTRNRDGSATLRSLVITEDSRVVRDVNYTRAVDGRLSEAFLRLQVGEHWVGSGHFRTQADTLHVSAYGQDFGHVTQSIALPTEPIFLATYSVMQTAWVIFAYDRSRGGEQLRRIYNTSTRRDGRDGPLGRLETCRIRLLGEEEVEVPAGRFKTTHFQLELDGVRMPAAHFWVAGQDRVLLRCDWPELDHEYVLTAWKTET